MEKTTRPKTGKRLRRILKGGTGITLTGLLLCAGAEATFNPLAWEESISRIRKIATITEASVRRLEKKYDIVIHGSYTNEDIQNLESHLTEYADISLSEMHLQEIYIAPRKSKKRCSFSARALWTPLLGGRMQIFSGHVSKPIVDHEVGHFWHYGYISWKSDFNKKWDEIAGDYDKAYSKTQDNNVNDTWYYCKYPSNRGPCFGYTKPYGAKNRREDVATHIEAAKNPDKIQWDRIRNFEELEQHRQKIRLICQYGKQYGIPIIRQHEYDNAMLALDQRTAELAKQIFVVGLP